MADFLLSCCSTIDLSNQKIEELGIKYIPFHYFLNEVEYVDDLGKTIPLKEFYNRMVQGEMTRTSQVNVEEYCSFWEPYLKEGKDVLHLTLSSGISGTINSARIASSMMKEKYPDRKIIVIDSLAASAGYGLLMAELADMKKQGKTIDEVAQFAEENKLNVHHWFYTTDLTFFIRGGRVSKTSGFIGNMLHICPFLNVSYEGKLIPREKIIGRKKCATRIVEKMVECAKDGLDYSGKCYISNSDCLEEAERVKALVEAKFPKVKVEIYSIGTVIGSHTGPGTIALFFFGNKRVD